jgi:hypothetical protein
MVSNSPTSILAENLCLRSPLSQPLRQFRVAAIHNGYSFPIRISLPPCFIFQATADDLQLCRLRAIGFAAWPRFSSPPGETRPHKTSLHCGHAGFVRQPQPQPRELQEAHPPLPATMKRAAREWPPFRVTQSSLVTLPPPDALPAAIHLHGNNGPSDRSPLVNPFRTCATIYSSVNSSSQTIIFLRNRCPLFPSPVKSPPQRRRKSWTGDT